MRERICSPAHRRRRRGLRLRTRVVEEHPASRSKGTHPSEAKKGTFSVIALTIARNIACFSWI